MGVDDWRLFTFLLMSQQEMIDKVCLKLTEEFAAMIDLCSTGRDTKNNSNYY
jgi:hypothetical protein